MNEADLRAVLQEELREHRARSGFAHARSFGGFARGAGHRLHGFPRLRHRGPPSPRCRYPELRLSQAHYARWRGDISADEVRDQARPDEPQRGREAQSRIHRAVLTG